MKRVKIRIAIAGIVLMFIVGIAYSQARFIEEGKVTVNPYTPTKITLRGVKGLFIYAPDIDYKISFRGTDYTPMEKGGTFNFSGIDVTIMELHVQADTETGLVYYILQK